VKHSGGAIEVIGHGGAGDFFPGNSRPAIEQALKIGVDRIEFDLQLSGSGELVLVHNEHIRLSNSTIAPVRGTAIDDIRRALTGLLTLPEAVELIGDGASLLIDVKAPGYERELVAEIQRLDIQPRVTVSSTYATTLHYLRKKFPAMRLGLSTGHLANGIPSRVARKIVSTALQLATPAPLLAAVRTVGATDVMVQYRVCSPYLVRLMHDHGVRVNTWTVDHPSQIERVLAMGVDGVISNRPDLVNLQLRPDSHFFNSQVSRPPY